MNAPASLAPRIPFRYPASELDKALDLADQELGREEAEFLALERYEAHATAQAASPIALTWGGIVGAGVLAVGGPPVAAVMAGAAAFVLVALVVESSLRRTAA